MGVYKGYQPNIFRAVSGSLFSSPINWSRGYVPAGSDVADIRDNCIIDISRTIGTLVVQSGVTASINSGLTLQINDVINVLGHLSCSGAPTVNVLSYKNTINSLSPGNSTFNFSKVGNQAVPGVTYNNVGIYYQGNKFATGNIIVSGNINYFSADTSNTSSVFELNQYDLSVLGFTSVTNRNHTLSKSKPGRILFTGQLGYGNPSRVLFTGNPTVEFRGGLAGDPDIGGAFLDSGVGTWIFSTNNQSIATFGRPINADIYISGSITLTIPSGQTLGITKILTGTSGSSVLANSGSLYFYTANPVSTFMTTGSANLSSSVNTVGFVGNYDLTIPNRFANLWSLLVSGTGTKTLGTSSVILGNLVNNTNGTFELGNQDLFVSGTTSIGDGATNIFRKSGPGNITFGGEIARLGWNSGIGSFDLSGGNPNVEVRGGIRTLGANTSTFKSGFGTWSFAVNNQRIYLDNAFVPSSLTFSGSVLIKDGINLSIGQNAGMGVVILQTINGTTSTARLTNSGSLNFVSSSKSMTTGTLDLSFFGNSIGWLSNENHNLYYSIYNSLYIGGLGTKYATSSLYMSSSLTMNNGALDIGTYDMFVSGTSLLQGGNLIKTSSGNIVFNGQISTIGGSPTITLSGSYIELRNGIFLDFSPNISQTHTFYFTTNNQIITGSNAFTNPQLNNTNFIISGAINLTISPALSLTFTGYIDGTDSNSKLTIGRGPVPLSPGGGIVYYSSSIMPMATSGTLDASSSLNVFVYNGAAQDIKGGIYRNLTFQGGTKTLRGNVSVLNTLSTGSTVVNLNGFTLTNP